MRKREELHLKALQKEHQQLKKEQFKAAQALHALRQVMGGGMCVGWLHKLQALICLGVQSCDLEAQIPLCLQPSRHNSHTCISVILLPQAEKELISDIAGGQGQHKNLTARQKALDEQLQRQGELMYAVDFSLQVRWLGACYGVCEFACARCSVDVPSFWGCQEVLHGTFNSMAHVDRVTCMR